MAAVSRPESVSKLVLLDPAVPPDLTSPMEPIPKGFVDLIASRQLPKSCAYTACQSK